MSVVDVSQSLSQFDDAFAPIAGQKLNLEQVSDGDYVFEIKEASLSKTPNTNEPIVRLVLEFIGGPLEGNTVERPFFFRAPEAANQLGAELRSLGIDTDAWRPERGGKFSVEMPKALPRLKGVRFNGNKSARKGTNKTFHNLYIKSLVDGYGPRSEAEVAEEQAANEDPF